jgi:dolichol-phosphate mannosyltransferase
MPSHPSLPVELAQMPPALSIVIAVHDDADNVPSLARELCEVLGERSVEIIFVDDASVDKTVKSVHAVRRDCAQQIRLLRHCHCCGPGIALQTGVRAARAEWIVTLDSDGQNDPADILVLLQALQEHRDCDDLKLIIGNRKSRHAAWLRRMSSQLAERVRQRVLHDDTPDTGCGIKLFHRATFLELPAFEHMQRFLPALFHHAGARVLSVEVRHRPRAHASRESMANRAWQGVVDLFGVRWLMRRAPTVTTVREE